MNNEISSMVKNKIAALTGKKKPEVSLILTYNCPLHCSMCNRGAFPTKHGERITVDLIEKLPECAYINLTGGEPFTVADIDDIVEAALKKADRVIISTNGYFTDRIIETCKKYPDVGIRISIEGMAETNNLIRGVPDGFDRGYKTLMTLRNMGVKNIGFGMVIQDDNADDVLKLYKLASDLGMEFATTTLHNSFYFAIANNVIKDRLRVGKATEDLVNELLRSNSPKKWFRAYYNHGLISYMFNRRLLPCYMGVDSFFVDPYGDVLPCNGTRKKMVMGNLHTKSWSEIVNSKEAQAICESLKDCRRCAMVGSMAPAMKTHIVKTSLWVIWHKFKALFTKKPYSMFELKEARDFRDGKITKEELDKGSTCEFGTVIDNGIKND